MKLLKKIIILLLISWLLGNKATKDIQHKQYEYTHVKKLTAPMLKELIEKIVVHQAEKVDGVQVQNIDIYYRCIGKTDKYSTLIILRLFNA